MMQDEFLPKYDFSEVHEIRIRQMAEKISPFIRELDFSGSWIIRLLFKLRGLTTGMTIKHGLVQENFVELGYRKDDELVLGLIGQFWKLNGNLQPVSPSEFLAYDVPGFLKATWNFKLTQHHENLVTLSTETRIKCLGEEAHRKFLRYWFVIRPFSGLIRKEILRGIKAKAEQLN